MVGTGSASTNAPERRGHRGGKPTGKALALTTDCNSRYVFADPQRGAMIAVAEAALDIIAAAGSHWRYNCLNFGNPFRPGSILPVHFTPSKEWARPVSNSIRRLPAAT